MAQPKTHSRGNQYDYALCRYALCRRRFRRPRGPGRPRSYCCPACRRLAQHLRDRHGASAASRPNLAGNGKAVAEHLQLLTSQLLDGERRDAQLEDLVKAAAAVAAGVERYVGAAVQDAREQNHSWAFVARGVRLRPDMARRKWPDCISQDTPPTLGDQAIEGAGPNHAEKKTAVSRTAKEQLGSALRVLLGVSGRTAGSVAEQAGVPVGNFSQLLDGKQVPEWPTVFTLTTILNGCPEDLRALWEWAKGRASTTAPAGATALARFLSAMRGQHLAAGRPTLGDLRLPSDLGLDRKRILESALTGDSMAGWEDVELLVHQLGGQPKQFRHLWEDVQYSIFTLSVKAAPDGRD